MCAARSNAAQSKNPQRQKTVNTRTSAGDDLVVAANDQPSAGAAGNQPSTEAASDRWSSEIDARAREIMTGRVQQIVETLKLRLSIPDGVVVSLVPKNPLVVSVERHDGGFVLSLEDGFLRSLADDELESVVAHELGHVWIFTHHPYLQTEELANQIAMRIVTRDNLARVYDKVWERTGVKGTVAYLPGK
jgi:hypothetical protein